MGAFGIADIRRLAAEELREYENERYQIDNDAWQMQYELEQDARGVYEDEQEQREVEEREARKCKMSSDHEVRMEQDKECRWMPRVHDLTEFKRLHEMSRARRSIRKGQRSEHIARKRARILQRRREGKYASHSRAHRGNAHHQQ